MQFHVPVRLQRKLSWLCAPGFAAKLWGQGDFCWHVLPPNGMEARSSAEWELHQNRMELQKDLAKHDLRRCVFTLRQQTTYQVYVKK